MSVKIVVILLFAQILPQACTWVQLYPEAENVRVLSANEVTKCNHIGETLSTTAVTVAGFPRNEEKIRRELECLGKNAATKLGGDAIVPDGGIHEGKQLFQVYRCVRKYVGPQ